VKNRLLEIRLNKGFKTQKEFAEFLGLKKSIYCKFENNASQPTTEGLYLMAKKLNMPMEDIIYYEEPTNL
jgi:transcriptional regulator with XRE-family HTH domain